MSDTRLKAEGCGNRGQLEAVIDLCDAAFADTAREYFERHMWLDKTIGPEDTRILVKGGTLVSSVQVFPRRSFVKGSIVETGGIGNVATLPSERRHGYAEIVLKNAIEYMRSRNWRLSLLTTKINSYYEKFGFRTINREIALTEPRKSMTHPGIRLFDKERDLGAVARLYEKYNADLAGPIVRDPLYWSSQLEFCDEDKNLFLVYEIENEIVAYVRAKRKPDRTSLMEYAYSKGHEDCQHRLFEHLHFTAGMKPLEVYRTLDEKPVLADLNILATRVDGELMINFLDDAFDEGGRECLLKDNGFTFWLTDFF
jgi:predicted N-acetyltransferase YhbS